MLDKTASQDNHHEETIYHSYQGLKHWEDALRFMLKIILLITEYQNVTSHITMNYSRHIKLLFSAEATTITPAKSSLYASGRQVHVIRFGRLK